MVASRADAEVLESGGRVSFEGWKNSSFPMVQVDRVIADGKTVRLGDVSLTAIQQDFKGERKKQQGNVPK